MIHEIDFLPDWYKENQRRQSSVQRQYIALGVLFLIMVVWNAVASREITKASAALSIAEPRLRHAERVVAESQRLQERTAELRHTAVLSGSLESRTDVAAVLAELSVLIGPAATVRSVTFMIEPFEGTPEAGPQGLRTRIVVSGEAEQAGQVGMLLSALEGSSYFRHVRLLFSRDVAGATARAEFEMECILADYVEAKEADDRAP